jgi:hypothetical protein
MCDIAGCKFIGTHPVTVSIPGGKLQQQVSLCEEHWFLFTEGDRRE